VVKTITKMIRAREDQKDGCCSAGSQVSGVGRRVTQERRGGNGAAVAWLLTKPDAGVFICRPRRYKTKYAMHRGKQVGKSKRRTQGGAAGDRPRSVVSNNSGVRRIEILMNCRVVEHMESRGEGWCGGAQWERERVKYEWLNQTNIRNVQNSNSDIDIYSNDPSNTGLSRDACYVERRAFRCGAWLQRRPTDLGDPRVFSPEDQGAMRDGSCS